MLREAFDTNLWSAFKEMSGDISIKPLAAFSDKIFLFFNFYFIVFLVHAS